MTTHKHIGSIVLSPRITEKGALLAERGAYVFNVAKDANKAQIDEAVRTMYKATPRMVRIINVLGKKVVTRGTNRKGMTAGSKKAYVYLKKGETIEFV